MIHLGLQSFQVRDPNMINKRAIKWNQAIQQVKGSEPTSERKQPRKWNQANQNMKSNKNLNLILKYGTYMQTFKV